MPNTAVCTNSPLSINLLSPEHLSDPFPLYSEMRKHHPVCKLEPGGYWAVSRYEDVQYVLQNPEKFSSAAYKAKLQPDWLSDEYKNDRFIGTMDPPEHTKYRALVDKAFSQRIINALIPFTQETAEHLVPRLADEEAVDFMEMFATPYIDKIIGWIVGTGDKQSLEDLRHWLDLEKTITPLVRPDDELIQEYETILERQSALFLSVIEDRRADPRDDLVSILVNETTDGKQLTDDMLMNALALLVSSANQTPVQMLGNTIIQLARRPDLLATLVDAPRFIPAFIEEMLRFNPPLHCAFRQTTCEVELAGINIAKGEFILIMLASANRDPAQFPEPDIFDIHRLHIRKHFAFGSGAHTCVGEALARLEIKIALETLLKNFTRISCPPDEDLVWAESLFVRGVDSLPASFQ